MKNYTQSLMLSGLLTAAGLFDANAQSIGNHHHDKSLPQPSALIITADMTLGDSVRYQNMWGVWTDKIKSKLKQESFGVTVIGTGYGIPELDGNAQIDSVTAAMASNRRNDLVYINSHGGIDSTDSHHMLLGHYVLGLKDDVYQFEKKYVQSTSLISGIATKAHEKRKKTSIIFDSCGGDEVLADLPDLPRGTYIQTFSQSQDVTFSSTVANAVSHLPYNASVEDLKKLHHSYNNYIYDDTKNAVKHKFAPSGSTLLMARENGQTVVWCPRKSICDRLGKGLSKKDNRTIIRNYKRMRDPTGRFFKMNKSQFDKTLDYVDTILKTSDRYETMTREQHIRSFEWLTFLEEETSLKQYKTFIKQEKERRALMPH